MRHINLQISLEPFKSRLPGVIPAIGDDGKFVKFNKDNIKYEYHSANYGMIPSDVVIPEEFNDKITDFTDYNVWITEKHGSEEEEVYTLSGRTLYDKNGDEVKVISYATLRKWYHFFSEYYNLLNSNHCNRPYTSATDYFEHEGQFDARYDASYYAELDRLFEARGGQEFYDWMTVNCFPRFDIEIADNPQKTKELQSVWGCNHLSYPSAIEWLGWFEERSKYSDCTDEVCCSGTDDCCECVEYVKRGGKEFRDKVYEWLSGVTKAMDDNVRRGVFPKSACFTVPLMFKSNIDDLGQMSIFSSEWERGADYGNDFVNSAGTVVHQPQIITDSGEKYIDNRGFIINGSGSGYEHIDEYRENWFNDTAWTDSLEYYVDKYRGRFTTDISSYTFNRHGAVVYNPSDDSEELQEPYSAYTPDYGVVAYREIPYPVVESDYIEYNGPVKHLMGKLYEVFYSGTIPYVNINNKKMFAIKDGDKYVFSFNGKKVCDQIDKKDCCGIHSGKIVTINGAVYNASGDVISVLNDIHNKSGETLYCKFDGSVSIEGATYFISGATLYKDAGFSYSGSVCTNEFEEVTDDDMIRLGWKFYKIEDDVVKIVYDYTVYNADELSGYTESYLSSVRIPSVYTDDMGNPMPGRYSAPEYLDGNEVRGVSYAQPAEGETLDLYYQVGSALNITPFDIPEEKTGNTKYFTADIIEEMSFFYKSKDTNEPITETRVIINLNNTSVSERSNLDAIARCKEKAREYFSGDSFSGIPDSEITCEFVYHLGATVCYDSGKTTYKLYENGTSVKYVERVHLVPKTCMYYLHELEYYPVRYYEVVPETENVVFDDFGQKIATVARSTFFKKVNLWSGGTSASTIASEVGKQYTALPLMRTEGNLGMAIQQNIDEDIYINRGLSAAFERYVKLGEVSTMEALANYGNGWFKMLTN